MKVINYCFSCNKEHDVTGLDVMAKGLKCECGGYYVTPSGKVMSKFIPETDKDYKLLGIEKKIKVWTIYLDGDRGWTTDKPEDFKHELENDDNTTFSQIDIETAIEAIQKLDTGMRYEIEYWEVRCEEMSQKEFDNLEEFTGW